jgi:hypothetical protein
MMRPLTVEEVAMHITQKETRGAQEMTMGTIIRNNIRGPGTVRVQTDATTAEKYMDNFGGRKKWFTWSVSFLPRAPAMCRRPRRFGRSCILPD